MAVTHYREALKFDPEHKGCKDGHKLVKKMQKSKEKGEQAFAARDYQEAVKKFEAAIAVDPNHAVSGHVPEPHSPSSLWPILTFRRSYLSMAGVCGTIVGQSSQSQPSFEGQGSCHGGS